ncbi:MAG TPA: TonB-dependent receptor [Bryobacteraceae bacterium]|nr:TonB-dependent receptor [Bryobacteraceae bacterium]
MKARRRNCVAPAVLACCALSALVSNPLRADIVLTGRVADENEVPIADARVSAIPAPGSVLSRPATPWTAQSGPTGIFRLSLPEPGEFLISAEHAGFYALKDRPIHVEFAQEITLTLNTVREVFQSTDVNAPTSPLDIGQAQNQEHLSGTEVNNIPYANSHSLRSALTLMPGVLRDPSGALHVNGASENQVLYLLNGFNITDPISGELHTILAVEGIRSVDVSAARFSPEYGQASAGVMSINTENGTDAFHYTATDFIPGLKYQQGVRLGNWFPRFGFSGPIVRGRSWFSDTFDSEYNNSLVTDLPRGRNTRSGWAGSNLLHTQTNLTPSNIFFADFLAYIDHEDRVGLGPLNPVSTTSNLRTRELFGSIKDQAYLGHTLIEFGYARNDFLISQTPQDQGLYIISTQGSSGNYFLNSTQSAARDQGRVDAFLPRFHFAGSHQIQLGVGAEWLHYTGDFRRTGYQVLGLNNELLSQTLYGAPALVRARDVLSSSYLLDTWRVSQRLQFDLGFRQDLDRRAAALAWSPRLGFSWSPLEATHTRISGGYAITHDAVTMDMLGRPMDQIALTTTYGPGGAPLGPPQPTAFVVGSFKLPRATNWNVNIDHQIASNTYIAAKYLRRRGNDGFVFSYALAPGTGPSLLPVPNTTAPGVYQLTNLRRDDYDSVQFSIRQTLSGQHEWMASYTRSRALSNALLDLNATVPLQVLPALVPMPWDAPNRFVGWTYLGLPWKNWSIAALADLRSGFPFSVRDPRGIVSGAVDSRRYPMNFDLNIAIERMLTLAGYRFALRGGMDNITNQTNPTAVNNVIGAPQFLQFYGAEGRHFVVRIRFFGRAGRK